MNSHNILKVMQTENSYEVALRLTDGVIIKGNSPFCDLTVGSSRLTEADALWGGIEGQGMWVHGEARGTGFPQINCENRALTESRSCRGERGWSSSWFLTRVGGKIESTLSFRGPSKEEAGTLALVQGRKEDQDVRGLKPKISTQTAVREETFLTRSTSFFS